MPRYLITAKWNGSDAVFALATTVLGSGAVEKGGAVELRTPTEADAAAATKVLYRSPAQT